MRVFLSQKSVKDFTANFTQYVHLETIKNKFDQLFILVSVS